MNELLKFPFPNQLHRGWNYLLVVLLFLTLSYASLYSPPSAQAAACPGQPCFNGYINNQPANAGSGARIYTVNPNVAGAGYRSSFVLIATLGDSGVGTSAFIQTGIAKSVNGGCGSTVKFIAEFIDRSGGPYNNTYVQRCTMGVFPAPGTDHTYTNEYDINTDYWCHDYDGQCIYSEPRLYDPNNPGNPATGVRQGSQVAAYGETNDNTIQNGSNFQQTVLSQIQYKNYSNQTFYYFTTPPYSPGAYAPCGGSCPTYHKNTGGAAGDGNKWYVQIWTS